MRLPSSSSATLRSLGLSLLLSSGAAASRPCPGGQLQRRSQFLYHQPVDQGRRLDQRRRVQLRLARRSRSFSGGLMTLQLDNATCPTGCSGKPYASDEYRTNDVYGYGTFTVHMRAAKASGIVSSFFIYNGTPWDEIDIEFLGKDTTKMQTNYFTNGVGGHETLINLGFDASAALHTYAIVWQSGSIKWYVDGVLVLTENGSRGPCPPTRQDHDESLARHRRGQLARTVHLHRSDHRPVRLGEVPAVDEKGPSRGGILFTSYESSEFPPDPGPCHALPSRRDARSGEPRHTVRARRGPDQGDLGGERPTDLRGSDSSCPTSDVRVNFWDPLKIVAAANDYTGTGQDQFYSTDGGATWSQSALPLEPGDAYFLNPVVDWTSDGTAWSVAVAVNSQHEGRTSCGPTSRPTTEPPGFSTARPPARRRACIRGGCSGRTTARRRRSRTPSTSPGRTTLWATSAGARPAPAGPGRRRCGWRRGPHRGRAEGERHRGDGEQGRALARRRGALGRRAAGRDVGAGGARPTDTRRGRCASSAARARRPRELAAQLETEGYKPLRHFQYLIVGAASHEDAEALATRLHGEVEVGGEVVLEAQTEAWLRDPFAIFGGLGAIARIDASAARGILRDAARGGSTERVPLERPAAPSVLRICKKRFRSRPTPCRRTTL